MMDNKLRVIVVDDTITYRKIIADLLSEIPDVEVVGTASNGKIALQKIQLLHPDLMTLDMEMPVMSGLEVLQYLKDTSNSIGTIVLSAHTTGDAKLTVKALSLGAFDFILKPQGNSLQQNIDTLRKKLRPIIDTFTRTRQVQDILHGRKPFTKSRAANACEPKANKCLSEERCLSSEIQSRSFHRRIQSILRSAKPVEIVCIGISTGGPSALTQLVPKLPADLAAPVLIVQHMPPIFTKSLADDLNKSSALTVCEAANGQVVEPGFVMIAPGGKQMKVRRESGITTIQITDDPSENSCRPSVDYLFRSVAEIYGSRALGVIMTGMGNDGTLGCRLLKECGAAIIAQDESSCVVFGMPKEPIEEGNVDIIAPLENIASEIVQSVKRGAVV
ncbi:MAG: chemotaxis response regulator protein-glutamate methylesterase [Pirellulales bacterium]|nr:chemotaxis response regulator protein-glutamate methylesterase [Pirellulales bacterium]